ncbi:MAG TPA: methyltransferase domain-containing protein, partial [Gammaproteobacteria bacterium]|nr:methyltransferase domain-containing protein [Gammaproteobacteria bacterium]
QAQRLDRQRLLQQLQLEPVHQVLDLDAGWGTRALFLAEETGVQVTAFARSMRQFEYLRHEARRRGLERLVHVRSGSFLQCRGLFDRVLAGDFLHHRRATEPRLALQHLAGLLRDDGFLWLGFPGRSHDVRLSNHWYRRQLATRGELPLLSRLSRALESTSLKPLLIEERSSHRLRTLQERARRFHRHRSAISRRFGETNTRHWEFLLASESTALQWGQLNYYEMLLGNPRCAWPAAGHDNSSWVHDLPAELVNAIPGLARDI